MDGRRSPGALEWKARLIQASARLGLERVGVATADPPAGWAFVERWVGKGYHGGMGYLARSLELRRAADALLPGCRSVIAVGMDYYQPNPTSPGGPRIARYALGRDYHKVVRQRLRALVRELGAPPAYRFRVCVDSAPILEREYAHRAGLGWFGKNTMLIDSRRGSWFVIGLVLTDLELAPDDPSMGGCGTCHACVEACPTGCILFEDGRWQVDARRCISALTIEHRGAFSDEQSRQIGDWTFGCDECQDVCPFNQPRPRQPLRAVATTEPGFLSVRSWPDLRALANLDEPRWDELTRGSPVRRAGLDGLRRNARANLANALDGPEL